MYYNFSMVNRVTLPPIELNRNVQPAQIWATFVVIAHKKSNVQNRYISKTKNPSTCTVKGFSLLLLLDLNFKISFKQFCLICCNSAYNKALRDTSLSNQKSFFVSFCNNKSQIRAKSAALICRKNYHFFMLHHTKNRQFVKLPISLVHFDKRAILHKSSALYYYNVHNNLIM